MLTYQTESLATCQAEIAVLLEAHFDEIALDQYDVPLDPDWNAYQALENQGKLHITTCRKDGIIIGYYAARVDTSPHYKSTLHAFIDVYYIKPEYRRGRVGYDLFVKAEAALKGRGVIKAISGTKIHESNQTGKSLDASALFKRLGWRQIESTYAKVL